MADQLTLDGLLALAEKATPGPYYVALDDAEECGPHANSGLSLVDTGRDGDWPIARLCETSSANLIAALSPEVVAALVRAVRTADAMYEARGRRVDGPNTRMAFLDARYHLDAALRGKP